MHRGYAKLYRKFASHPFWREKRVFSRAEAWIDILWCVQHKEGRVKHVIKNRVVYTERGESIQSLVTWAERWNWSKSATRRYFNLLKKMQMIDAVSVTVTTRIKVLDFDIYNPLRRDSEPEVNLKRNASEFNLAPDKNVKKDKKVKHTNQESVGGDKNPRWEKSAQDICRAFSFACPNATQPSLAEAYAAVQACHEKNKEGGILNEFGSWTIRKAIDRCNRDTKSWSGALHHLDCLGVAVPKKQTLSQA